MSTENDFSGLRSRLADLTEGPAPASPFDPVRTAAAGRRRVLARRTTAAGGTGTLAVAMVFGIVAAFAPGAPLPARPASGIGADPLAKRVDFGWLPASLPNVSYISTADGVGTEAVAEGNKTPDGAPRVDLMMLSGDGLSSLNGNERSIPVHLNDGREAYWVTQSAGGGLTGDFQLRFPAKDGRWAEMQWSVNWGGVYTFTKISGAPGTVTVSPPDHSAPTSVPASPQWQQDLVHMATEVTDAPAQIPLPLRITGLPDGFKPETAFLWHPSMSGEGAPGTWNVLLIFDYSGLIPTSLEVGPHGTLSEQTTPAAKGTECTTSGGLDVCVQGGNGSRVLAEVGGQKGLLKMVTLLGPDEKQWTTDVMVP